MPWKLASGDAGGEGDGTEDEDEDESDELMTKQSPN